VTDPHSSPPAADFDPAEHDRVGVSIPAAQAVGKCPFTFCIFFVETSGMAVNAVATPVPTGPGGMVGGLDGVPGDRFAACAQTLRIKCRVPPDTSTGLHRVRV
jgi:hypothetical protein